MTKILFLIGLALCVAGLVAGGVTAKWSLIPIVLLSLGIILIVIWLALIIPKRSGFWARRSTQSFTNAVIATAAIIVILGMINFMAIRSGLRWDLTENKIYTLAPQSQSIVANLDQPLKVWVFERHPNIITEKLLENYRRYSPNFQFKFVDPEVEIGLAEKFKAQSLGEIYLEYGDKRQRINLQSTALGANLTESQLTNAIEKIKRGRTATIYFLQGHGESPLEPVEGGLSQATKSLEDRGYIVKTLNLATSAKIPDDAEAIVIAGATRKLFPAEAQSLQQYLDLGGRLLLMLAPNTDIGLTSLLQAWGVELDDRLIIDPLKAANILNLGPAAPIIDSYGDHPITQSFGNGISIFPESRPLKLSDRAIITQTPLVVTNEQTWAESNLTTEEIGFDPQTDLPGPLNIAIALNRTQPKRSRLVIFGSATFATNGWFEQQLNGDLFLNSLNWLIGEDKETLAIRPKEATNRRLNITPVQAALIVWLASIVVPLLALIVAGILWWKRR